MSAIWMRARSELRSRWVATVAAMATIAHTLVTSIRRKRRDLAILKTLGFLRRQISRTVAWQAAAFATIASLVGIPLGVAAGRIKPSVVLRTE